MHKFFIQLVACVSCFVYITEGDMKPFVTAMTRFTNLVSRNRIPILSLGSEEEFDGWFLRRYNEPYRGTTPSPGMCRGLVRRIADYNQQYGAHDVVSDFSATALRELMNIGEQDPLLGLPARVASWGSAGGNDRVSPRLGMGIIRGKRLSRLLMIEEHADEFEGEGNPIADQKTD